MASEGASTVPRMGSFKRALLGYRRGQVDAAIGARDARFGALEQEAREAAEAAVRAETEASSLSGMVIERCGRRTSVMSAASPRCRRSPSGWRRSRRRRAARRRGSG